MSLPSSNSHKSRNIKSLPYLLLAIAPLCWAGNAVLARGVIHIIPPVSLAFWRWVLAFLFLLPFAFKHAVRDWPFFIKHWKMICFLSLAGVTCFNTLLYIAAHTTTAINVALIQTMMPAAIILISWIAFKEKVTRLQSLGVGFCILGACLVALRGRFSTFLELCFVEGDVLMLVAVFAPQTADASTKFSHLHLCDRGNGLAAVLYLGAELPPGIYAEHQHCF